MSNGLMPWNSWMLFCRRITFAFLRQNMDKNPGPSILRASENTRQSVGRSCPFTGPRYVIPISSKKHTRNDQLFDTALRPADLLDQRIPDLRDLLKRRCHAFLQPGIKICCPDLCQISGHSSDIFQRSTYDCHSAQ